jgi:hypothetical protein
MVEPVPLLTGTEDTAALLQKIVPLRLGAQTESFVAARAFRDMVMEAGNKACRVPEHPLFMEEFREMAIGAVRNAETFLGQRPESAALGRDLAARIESLGYESANVDSILALLHQAEQSFEARLPGFRFMTGLEEGRADVERTVQAILEIIYSVAESIVHVSNAKEQLQPRVVRLIASYRSIAARLNAGEPLAKLLLACTPIISNKPSSPATVFSTSPCGEAASGS